MTVTQKSGSATTAVAPRPSRRTLLAAGLAAGTLLAYMLYLFFDPVNLFALNLQRGSVGTTNVTTLSIGAALALVSGATMIFTPCGMPLIFSLNSIAKEGVDKGHSWVQPLGLFTIGIVSVMALWGVVIATVGGGIVDFLAAPSRLFTVTEILYTTLGVLALLLALWEFEWIHLPRLSGPRAMPSRLGRLNPYPRSLAMGAALGGGFGVGCPFPTYQAVLIWAALVGNPLYGAILLGANALGRALPLWIIAGVVYRGGDQRTVARWLLSNSARAKRINGTALSAFAGLMIMLWGVLVPFVLQPAG
ncbi:MAG: cytochrome c biogenesis CcdA family protein [Acidimicrobiales bacterium]